MRKLNQTPTAEDIANAKRSVEVIELLKKQSPKKNNTKKRPTNSSG